MNESFGEQSLDGEGQIIMPFYLIFDVSGSMSGDMGDVNKAMEALHQQLLGEPIINDLVMMSVITFNHQAQTVVGLAAPEDVTLPRLTASGGTDFGAAFREFHKAFQADRARLKGEGKRVFRPCIYFLTDGESGDASYQQTFTSLLAKENNPSYPYVCAFGFRDATEATLKSIAYPNFGEQQKHGRYFLAKNASVTQMLTSMVGALAQSILQSARSATQGAPQVTMPPPQSVPGMVGSFV